MAPYFFDVKIDNEVDEEYPIHFARHDTYKGLDGTTEVWPIIEEQDRVRIKKSGGTDGLFTTLSFWVGGDSEEEAKLKFDVYCEMAASAGAHARARLGDCAELEAWQFRETPRSIGYHGKSDNNDKLNKDEVGDPLLGTKGMRAKVAGPSWSIPIGDAIEQNGLRVQLIDRDLGYNQSTARVKITSIEDE